MYKNLMFCFALFFTACSATPTNSIIGTWETGIIESEWGPNKIVITYFSDGTFEGVNHFRGDGNSKVLEWRGTYIIKGNTMLRTVDSRRVEIKFDISNNRMYQYIDDEVYEFKRR